ncbi:transposase [Arthrobacter silviterrae]|nr:transposase [Arthrobacter silviterrae]
MPALPSFLIEPLWCQFEALIPPVANHHPLGCHRPRITNRVVFDKLIQVLVLGASYEKISDTGCSATTIRCRLPGGWDRCSPFFATFMGPPV